MLLKELLYSGVPGSSSYYVRVVASCKSWCGRGGLS